MAFSITDRQPGGNSGEISIGLTGKAVEIWTVVADNYNYTTEDIRNSGLFPEVYTTFHAQNSRLRLQPIGIEQDADNSSLFICTVTWSSEKYDTEKEEEKEDNPINRKSRITVRTGKLRVTTHRDMYGTSKINPAGDLYDPPLESSVSYRIVTVRKNVVVFPDWIFDFDDTVNSVPFTIKGRLIDTGCAWLADIELGEENTDGPVPYCEARIEMHVRRRRKPTSAEVSAGTTPPSPWQTEQLNEGLFQKVGGVRKRIQVLDDSGATVNAPCPVPLDENGVKITNPTPDTVTYTVFRDHLEFDFNEISYLWSDA